METKLVVVENVSNLNNVIAQTFHTTQRIKLISFDVSQNYLIFGASSGGLYIFERNPCQFKKLIPGKGGVADLISISPNEKNIAIANSKGLIIILENCFVEDACRYQIYTEHEGQTITSLKWNNLDLYCGDSRGKVSVILSLTLLTKAIFHTPVAAILNLDSPIIQIDSLSKYLLVSTKARTFICDTEKEYFKPIGKKLRDGPFGACFLPKPEKSDETSKPDAQNLLYKELKSSSEDIAFCKIYCSRPGGRLWEANFEGSVVCTHQFRNTHINKEQTEIIVLREDPEAQLSIVSSTEFDKIPESFNFEKLYVISERLLLTFNKSGLYIFDPTMGSLIFFNNCYQDIKDLKVLGSSVFIWRNKEVTILSILTIEELILQTLFSKHYLACAQICVKFSEHVLECVEKSSKIHLIGVLKAKLNDCCDDLLEKLTPLLEKVQHISDQQIMSDAQNNGIKVVENAHYIEEGYSINDIQIPEGLLNFKTITAVGEKINEGTRNIKEKFFEFETKVKKLTTDSIKRNVNLGNKYDNLPRKINEFNRDRNQVKVKATVSKTDSFISEVEDKDPDDIEYKQKILLEQYQVNKIHKNVETSRVTRLYNKVTLESLKELFNTFVSHARDTLNEDASIWCKEQYLRYVHKKKLHKEISSFKKDITDYLYECFCIVNSSKYSSCSCGYPLPGSSKDKPLYHEIGLALINGTSDITNMRSRVSYMWKHYLLSLPEDDIPLNIPLILQYGDTSLVKKFLKYFFYDTWDDAIKYYIRLRSGHCLNCDSKFKCNSFINWTDFGLLMLESVGGLNTMKLMQSYTKHIPNGELDSSFYQACVFVTSVGGLENSFGNKPLELFFKLYGKRETRIELEKSLTKFLKKKYLENAIENNFPVATLNCAFCDMPVNLKIFECKISNCGHFFHDLCLIYNNNICTLCNKVS